MAVNNLHRSLALALRKEWHSGVNLVWEKAQFESARASLGSWAAYRRSSVGLVVVLISEHTLVVICPLSTSKRGAATARTNDEPTGA